MTSDNIDRDSSIIIFFRDRCQPDLVGVLARQCPCTEPCQTSTMSQTCYTQIQSAQTFRNQRTIGSKKTTTESKFLLPYLDSPRGEGQDRNCQPVRNRKPMSEMKGLNELVHQQFHMEKVASQRKFVLPFRLKKADSFVKKSQGPISRFGLCQFLFQFSLV